MKEAAPLTGGTLYLVATPIGNLEDITARALRVLRECDLIAAEDTRRTGLLLQAFAIKKPMLSYFRFNEARREEEIVGRLRQGEKIALVTDAGSPGICDPGERVVRAALAAGCSVQAVPGPCALIAGLTASGLPTEEFHFGGFLPVKAGQRRRKLAQMSRLAGTLVLYESPYRVPKLLGELAELMPTRRVVLTRELTKKFEERLAGTPKELAEILAKRSLKGEFVVLIEGHTSVGGAGAGAGAEPDLYARPITTVGALIFNRQGEVLMVQTHKWSNLWGIPGGKPEFGESSEEALRREIREETGLEVEGIEFMLVQDCIHSTEFYRDAHFVLLNYRCTALPPGEVRLNDEAEKFRWLAPQEAVALELNRPTRVLLERWLADPAC